MSIEIKSIKFKVNYNTFGIQNYGFELTSNSSLGKKLMENSVDIKNVRAPKYKVIKNGDSTEIHPKVSKRCCGFLLRGGKPTQIGSVFSTNPDLAIEEMTSINTILFGNLGQGENISVKKRHAIGMSDIVYNNTTFEVEKGVRAGTRNENSLYSFVDIPDDIGVQDVVINMENISFIPLDWNSDFSACPKGWEDKYVSVLNLKYNKYFKTPVQAHFFQNSMNNGCLTPFYGVRLSNEFVIHLIDIIFERFEGIDTDNLVFKNFSNFEIRYNDDGVGKIKCFNNKEDVLKFVSDKDFYIGMDEINDKVASDSSKKFKIYELEATIRSKNNKIDEIDNNIKKAKKKKEMDEKTIKYINKNETELENLKESVKELNSTLDELKKEV